MNVVYASGLLMLALAANATTGKPIEEITDLYGLRAISADVQPPCGLGIARAGRASLAGAGSERNAGANTR